MSFRQPFRAVPLKPGDHYQRKQRNSDKDAVIKLFVIAAAAGAVIGVGSIALSGNGPSNIFSAVKPIAVSVGIMRARQPQAGDFWRGCNDARAAGTAPIYAGEPGYRENMDGDGDGIACEPYR
ncbi:MAG: excalibur calcium-binding domain-containing protein [Pseudomonadota bacterium]|nr:excalibur calcium-binding domain-containing protein [Pseudomonadota bacterium]